MLIVTVDFRTIGGSASGTPLYTKFLPIGEVYAAPAIMLSYLYSSTYIIVLNR